MIRRWLVLGILFAIAAPAQAQPQPQPQPKERDVTRASPAILTLFRPAVARISESTVLVRGDDKDLSLGAIVDADGYILTKYSELHGKLFCRLKDGKEYAAKVIGVHEPMDLALLKIPASGLKPVEWTDSSVGTLGSWVASPGLGEEPLAIGVVSVTSRKITSRTAPPIRSAGGGYLGVSLDPEATGARVAGVLNDTPAQKAGVKVNDIIVAVDKTEIDSSDALIQLLQKYKPGVSVALKIKRGEEDLEIKAMLANRPSDRADFQNRLGSELSERRTGFPIILQHDSVLRARDCGGPLVDLEGRVIGINVARAGRTESYAIPSEAVKPLLPDLKAGKFPPPSEESVAAEKLQQAQAAVVRAEAARTAVDNRLTAARSALQKATTDKAEESKLVELRTAVQKVEAEKAALDKKLADARAALAEAKKK